MGTLAIPVNLINSYTHPFTASFHSLFEFFSLFLLIFCLISKRSQLPVWTTAVRAVYLISFIVWLCLFFIIIVLFFFSLSMLCGSNAIDVFYFFFSSYQPKTALPCVCFYILSRHGAQVG